ncbi:MAG: hypothetical protein GX561_04790 [Lentisphaerae bacterium]|jgi:hypothetical protein|nr:hypothetical protein [Lentisphaerota bacterium]
MRRALLLISLLMGVGTACMAYDTTPLQIAIWPPSLQVVPPEIDVSGLKLNLPYGGNETIVGVDLGIASTSNNTSALQINLVNCAHERFSGFQVGLLNLSGESRGLQIGVLMNSTDEVGSGLQIGIINSTTEMNGVQIGLINYTHFMIGFQVGLVNIIRESIVPFFPIVNFCF